jgi:hypothetical protein
MRGAIREWEEDRVTKIIKLEEYRGGIKHSGIRFPHLYRVTGFSWAADETGRLIPDTKYPCGPFYTLDDADRGSLCNTKYEPISCPDSSIDRGWIVVRHHRSTEALDGYMNGYSDMEFAGFDENPGAVVYQTKTGLFTCVHRPATPGRPEPLLIYVVRGTIPDGPGAGMSADDNKIIDCHGKELDDSVLCGPEEEDVCNPCADQVVRLPRWAAGNRVENVLPMTAGCLGTAVTRMQDGRKD